ncbi:hypothetical protein CEXT_543571 [Caerostris extrusa]|uniref:Uncharacterized protein n=1 Tax=Caerostris extrusa TaxID=172846 RepID=A0AAV4VKX7_CAEEX|nr:hypothetical protein CEXT_543571 [Caerostris extrusa]
MGCRVILLPQVPESWLEETPNISSYPTFETLSPDNMYETFFILKETISFNSVREKCYFHDLMLQQRNPASFVYEPT